jgi:hypothetical protein
MNGIAYTFDPQTGEYKIPVVAQESPLEPGTYWLPAHSTDIEPPITATPDQVPVWNGTAWSLQPDFRGKVVYDRSDALAALAEVTSIGPIPTGWTLSKPPSPVPQHAAVYVADAWELRPDFRGQIIYDQSSANSETVSTIGPIPTGWSLTPPPPPVTLDKAKGTKIDEINLRCTVLLDAVKAGYPNNEVLSWDKQESEARAYVVNNAVACPMLSALATGRGVPLADVVANVIQKADQFAVVSGQIIGTRQKYKDQINAAADIATVNAITWP